MTAKARLESRLQFARPTRYKGIPINGPHYVEPSIEGVRAALVFRGEEGTALSLLGREIVNAYPVLDEIKRSRLLEDVVIDGEFTASTEEALRWVTADLKRLPDTHGLRFYAYDIMTVQQWDEKICEMPLHFRKSVLAELILKGNFERTVFTETIFSDGTAEREKAKATLRSRRWSSVVYKDIEAPYPFGPTTDWWVDRS